jgi:hypothetical protein
MFTMREALYNMQQSMQQMLVAVRVLDALTARRNPDPQDVEHLREIAPEMATAELDELACAVIHRAIRHRAEVRKQRSGA